ncbi:ankyrin repeat-containing protein BDA1-like isoform X2 [Prosopis cineraria]|uniref:ankyrin repeat-containing protein BDA1-like isoform X2 n=1 Tax=Prosopis cineraria TaxID=364024 RepID=UPI0024109FF3|nr:ankyrin repeat-containing protein BDA1-like isoform X2 [Prosopis cineraria]
MELVKMETARHDEDEKTRILYDASYKGNVLILNSLTKQDPLILHKICSRTPFVETPLHISPLLGHLEFTKALLALKPTLAHELDSFQGTALHLASAEGRIDIVKELLLAFDQACLVRDQEGRIPLHYAVIRRRLEVVIELIRAKPETRGILDKGKTIFHLCVTYNHLEILKALVELNIGSNDLPHLKDQDEKTVLDLAIRLKQVETVRYLLSIPEHKRSCMLGE